MATLSRRFLLYTALTGAIWATPPPFFPLQDVRPGLKAVGRTVFQGDTVSEFPVEILGVVENLAPRQSLILARLSGPEVERTGVMQGMSGSPVYIDGKLLGAVAFAFPFSKEPIAGIRPAQQMVEGVDPVRPRRPAPVADAGQPGSPARLVPIATPVTLSGFSERTAAAFATHLAQFGLTPSQGLGGAARSTTPVPAPRPPEPGSMISVQLVSGDLAMAADGTVTFVDGQRVYAFGHQFMELGTTELPFHRSRVIALLPNLQNSFKISQAVEPLGTITSDRTAAVVGELGRTARTVPVHLTVMGPHGKQEYRLRMVHDATLTPFLLQMAIFSTLEVTERTLGTATVNLRGTAQLANGLPAVTLRHIGSTDYNAAQQAAQAAAAPLASALQGGPANQIRVESIEIESVLTTDKRQATIEGLTLSARRARPGETIMVSALFTDAQGRALRRDVPVRVPAGAQAGPLTITLQDAMTANLQELPRLLDTAPRSAREWVEKVNSLRANDRAYLRLTRPDGGYVVQGEALPDPPASVALILSRQIPAANNNKQATLFETEIPLPDMMVTGSKSVQVEVKE